MWRPEGKKLHRRPLRRREYNIKLNLHEVGCGGMGLRHLAQDKGSWQNLVKAVMNYRFLKSREFLNQLRNG